MITQLRHLPSRLSHWVFHDHQTYTEPTIEDTTDQEDDLTHPEVTSVDCTGDESMLEEAYLKRILLKFLLDKELQTVALDPAKVHEETVMLSFLYEQFLYEFPPFKKHENFKEKLDRLLKEYPRWVTKYKSATKDEPTSYRNLINFFDILVRTPGEIHADQYEHSSTDVLNARRESLLAFHSMLKDSQTPDGSIGIDKLLAPFIECNHIRQLPQNYQRLFGFVSRKYAPIIQLKLVQNQARLRKVKMIYALSPVRAMKVVLAITNPSTIVHSFLTLLFTKPLGGKNLMQRVVTIATDVHKTEKQIRKLNEDLLETQGDEELENKLDKLELRRKDKMELIELFGDDQIIDLLKECLPCIYEPLFELYRHADTLSLLDETFSLVKKVIDIADSEIQMLKVYEDSQHVVNHYQRIYTRVLMEYEHSLFMFVKSILQRPESRILLEEILQWLFGSMLRFQSDNAVIDVKRILHDLPKNEHDLVVGELQQYTKFKINKARQRKKVNKASLASTPEVKHIPKFMWIAFIRDLRNLFKRVTT